MNASEFAAAVGIHRNTARDWLERGRIVGTRTGRDWQIPSSEVERVRAELTAQLADAGSKVLAAQLFAKYVHSHVLTSTEALHRAASTLLEPPDDDGFNIRVTKLREALSRWDQSTALVAALAELNAGVTKTSEELEDQREPGRGWLADPDDPDAAATRAMFARDAASRTPR